MSDVIPMDVHATAMDRTSAEFPFVQPSPPAPLKSTVLASLLPPHVEMTVFAGTSTAAQFGPLDGEISALLKGWGVFDLGWRGQIEVRGEDRLRWLSGMTTNAVQQLPEGEGNYSFFLNAQGRIQGDVFIYREAGRLVLDTSADQVGPIMAHLDRFIIMDDVVLGDQREEFTGIGLAGPQASPSIKALGLPELEISAGSPIRFASAQLGPSELTLVAFHGPLSNQYAIYASPEAVISLWQRLLDAGATACGVRAIEGLRVLEGLPRYGVDLGDRDLPQETGQTRALNFSKGCYLGQEIVERVRSRGAVHRTLRQFHVEGVAPQLPASLKVNDTVIGKLTSLVSLAGKNYGLGIVRSDAVNGGMPLTYNGGVAIALDRPPDDLPA